MARYNAEGTFSGRITGTRDSLAISFTGNITVGASCGQLDVNIGVTVSFSYTAPTRVSMKVELKLKFGVNNWTPTVFSVAQG